jgi:hypothetical protein
MTRLLAISLMINLLSILGFGQEASWQMVGKIDRKATSVYLDQLNNVYVAQRGELVKLDEKGKELTRYSNKMIGEDVHLDVMNPMKVLVFSAEQMRLIFLDSRMSELRDEINLYNEGYEQISLAATSHSNGFWLYDPINFRLIRYDQFFKKERESLNIAQLLRVEFYPTDLVEVDNKVYLTDPKHGVYVFDVFGNYVKRIPLKEIETLRIANNRLFFERGEKVYSLHLIDSSEEWVNLSEPLGQSWDINRTQICTAKEKGIFIFKPKP